MLRSVLVGIDGSPYSESALQLGLRLCKERDALLVGLGIVDELTIREGQMVPLGAHAFTEHSDELRVQEAQRQVEGFLGHFTHECAKARVACKVLEDVGDPLARIQIEAQRYDLIVLGQQTYFRFETQEFADDTMKGILRHSPRPVLVVPDRPQIGSTILVAYDGSLPSARALQYVVLLGLAMGRKLHVLTVKEDVRDAVCIADRAIDFLQLHDVTAERHVSAHASGDVAMAILEQAQQLNAELLVLGAYGRSTLHQFFFGSVTNRVLQESCVPLFMCH